MATALSLLILVNGSAPYAADPWRPLVPAFARFTSATSAVVEWETREPIPPALMFGEKGGELRRIVGRRKGRRCTVSLQGLVPGRRHIWQLVGVVQGEEVLGEKHELDTGFCYTPAAVSPGPDPWGDEDAAQAAARRAAEILDASGVRKGYAVLWGVGDGRLALELARQSELVVHCLERDAGRLERARVGLYKAGAYGHRVTVRRVASAQATELARCFANLLVAVDPLDGDGTLQALRRLVRPDGGVFVDAQDSVSIRWKRPALEGAGSWTHLYGRPDNGANSGDTLSGATESSHMEVQWLGRPGPDAMTDRNPRKPSPLAEGGRVFTQGLKRIIAQDQYNGAILWALELPAMQRLNMPRDCSNWCVDRDSLFIAVRDGCWKLDPETGARISTWPVAAVDADRGAYWGYLASLDDLILGSVVRPEAVFTNIFGGSGEGWADATKGPVTRKVLSDALFAVRKADGQRIWTRRNGLVINPTITVGGGTLYFLECRNQEVMAGKDRAVERPELWQDLWLVALDPATGEQRWERPVNPAPGKVVVYLTWAKDTLLLVTSGARYELYAYSAKDGKDLWHRGHSWPSNHHGRHMQHPTVLGDLVVVRPHGYAIADGELRVRSVPDGGCGTISASANVLTFRSGTIRMWEPDSGKYTDWRSLRPGCWLSTITAGGMLLAPEAGGGCSCAGWFETSVGFLPREDQR